MSVFIVLILLFLSFVYNDDINCKRWQTKIKIEKDSLQNWYLKCYHATYNVLALKKNIVNFNKYLVEYCQLNIC